MNAEDRNNHFMYYMRSLLKQLQTMFPECIATAILSEKLANDNSAAGSKDLVEKWQQYMGDSETDVAIRTKDVAKVLDNNNPIMTMLSIKAKYGDPRLTENSRRVLWQFIEKLHTLAVQDTRTQGIVDISLPPPPSTELLLLFIQTGGDQGEPSILIFGLSCKTDFKTGIRSTRSGARLKLVRFTSV